MKATAYISNAHPSYIESLYEDYQKDAASVDPEWKKFFEGFEFAQANANGNGAAAATNGHAGAVSGAINADELKVYSLIQGYRERAHLESDTNPIRKRRDRKASIDTRVFGLGDELLDKEFAVGAEVGLGKTTLRKIVDRLREVYLGSIGFEFSHITDVERKNWLYQQVESQPSGYGLSIEDKKQILFKLNQAVVLEEFLGNKYLGEKRFSLEGGEGTIPALDAIIQQSAALGVEEAVIGMAHRGRLSVLANIMGKTYDHIFSEFESNTKYDLTMGDGDVKYHLGYSTQFPLRAGGTVQVKLVPNPSHLESVNPVVEGFARAKADTVYGEDFRKILPILIHGDAAVAGQGPVYEVLQMSQLDGYFTGGSIHFVINNQVGFTTDFDDARSSHYSTSIATTIGAPIIHVNGDDAEAVVFAANLAAAYRAKFQADIFIDMVCYRRHGHNEADDPKFTQPKLYALIDKHKNPRDLYIEQLTSRGDVNKELAETMETEFKATLQDRLDMVKQKPFPYTYQKPEIEWKKLRSSKPEDFLVSPETGVAESTLDKIATGLSTMPDGFSPLRKVNRILKGQKKLVDNKKVDWALAELFAYGSLMLDGHDIRMSGQDVKRGTFSHRHAIFVDEKSGAEHNRLEGVDGMNSKFRIYNSLLSEFAVLGFEFGYSLVSPQSLVIWEAQFGDFANGAQTIIDQYITASESKWMRQSGLVMLLPHGYEGMGPEHSSARLERFLQSCAQYNMTVANISSPANFFHAIRRQLNRPFRKPLVVMSPKSLLRHPMCQSDYSELVEGNFKEVIDDKSIADAKAVKKVLFCAGKIYYDLLEHKSAHGRDDVAIVRVEQLYPLPGHQIDAVVKKYEGAELYWVQEEPSNMGAWGYVACKYRNPDLVLIARKASASPATGYKKVHVAEQQALLERAFA